MNKNILFAVLAATATAGLLGSLAAYGGTAQASPDEGAPEPGSSASNPGSDILDLSECYPNLDKEYPALGTCDADSLGLLGSILVSGSAETSVDPDLLVVRLGVNIVEPTAAEALAENSRTLTEVVGAIMAAGITEDEISTSYLSIHPDYSDEWDESGTYKRVLTGYRATNTITVTTSNLTIAADILDGAVGAGANTVESVRFALSPQVEKEVREGLITEAVSDALNKAEIALAPLDQEILGVKSVLVDVDEAIAPVGRLLESAAAFASVDASTPIFSSDQTIRTSVTITFVTGPG